MYNQLSSLATLGNTGRTGTTENLGYWAKILWVKPDFEIATEAAALLEATWVDAVDLFQVYPFPYFEQVENQDEDDVKESLPTGLDVFIREGKIKEMGSTNLSLMTLQNLRTFNNVKGSIILISSNGYIMGYSPDGVKLKGFTLQNFHVGGIGKTDGTTQRRTPVSWGISDSAQVLDYGVAIKPTWNPLDLEGILDVDIAVQTDTNALCEFTVKRTCDGEGVDGLVAADFNFLVTAGTAQTGSTFAEVGNGAYKYTSSGTTFTTGTIDLKLPSAQTTGGYESTGAATFTV
jgi:hypothetical protein